jgi:hypothetical protein
MAGFNMSTMLFLVVEDAGDTDDCILWLHGLNKDSYPQVCVERRTRLGHRLVCERYHGPCPPGKEVAHSCAVRNCINPKHLRWATHKDNMRDHYEPGWRDTPVRKLLEHALR